MSIETLQEFFFLCMLINIGVYLVTAIATLALRGFICRLQANMFGISEATVCVAMYAYLGMYKLLITVFAFIPWLAILIMK